MVEKKTTGNVDSQPKLAQESPSPQRKGWQERLATKRFMIALGGVSLLLLALAALAVWYFAKEGIFPKGGSQVELGPPTTLRQLSTLYPELSSILNDPELDSVYKEFLIVYQQEGEEAAFQWAKRRGLLNSQDELRLTLELDTSNTADLQQQLEAKGIRVTAVSGNQMDIAIPLEVLTPILASGDAAAFLAGITGLEHVLRVRTPYVIIEDTNWYQPSGSLDSQTETESMEVIGVPAWHAAGFTGKGVKIGIVDVGFDRYRELLGTDLPEDIVVRSFTQGLEPDEFGTAHGTAVTEIVYDIAPDAQIFCAAFQTDVEFRLAIDWLLSQGVQIIQNSTGIGLGPMDGSGADAQLVDSIVRRGILWVNAAGNQGNKHFRGTFTDADGDGWHEFAPGDELLTIAAANAVRLILNWDDWQNGNQDYDLFLMDENQNEMASSQLVQDGAGDPAAEVISYDFPSEPARYLVAIYASNATRPVVFNFHVERGLVHPDYLDPFYSVVTPADARLSLTVGATFWGDDSLEEYSSRGPTNDERLKPEINAPSRVTSAAMGDVWDGTSASAPHVSGAAVLVLQAHPDFSVQQLTDFLLSRAVDLGESGSDNSFGVGRLFLGEPPQSNVAPPVPTSPPPSPTAEMAATATPTSQKTSTPAATKTPNPFVTVKVSNQDWLLVACIAIPGLAGVGGMGLLAAIVFFVRSRRAEETGEGYAQPASYEIPAPPVLEVKYRPPFEAPAVPARPQAGLQYCISCGKLNQPDSRYCNNCGKPLEIIRPPSRRPKFCRYCGASMRPGSKFCPNCGRPR